MAKLSTWLEALSHLRTFKAWAKKVWEDQPMRARQVLLAVAVLVLLSFCTGKAIGAAAVTEQPATTWSVYRSTTVIATTESYEACVAAARQDAATRAVGSYSYGCQRGRDRLTISVAADAPAPVNCAVSEWGAWTGGTWSACSNGQQSRPETRARTVTRQPANGGAACPALTEVRTVTQTCSSPAPDVWVKAADEWATFTLYAPAKVRFGTGNRWAVKDMPAGVVQCTFAVFGDPAVGDTKRCEVSPGSALQNTTPPAPPTTPAVGTASLSWNAPTSYTDGSPLAGAITYRVYSGASTTTLKQIGESSSPTFTVQGLASGTHYFAVSAVVSGVESTLSGTESKVIP